MSGYSAPPGPPPPPGFYGPPGPPQPPAPQRSHHSGRSVLTIFVGGLIVFGVVAVAVVILMRPPAPEPPCQPGEACNPPPGQTLPPDPDRSPAAVVTPTPATQTPAPTATPIGPGPTPTPVGPGPTPGPTSDAPPHVSGTVWRSETLGYSFEYAADDWRLAESSAAYAELALGPAALAVFGWPGDVGVADALGQVMAQIDGFVIGRTVNSRSYDALLGPSIGYVRGDGAVYSGTLRNADGTPGEPAGVVTLGSTNGRITIVVVLLVERPDRLLGDETLQFVVRKMTDRILKTFDWGTGP